MQDRITGEVSVTRNLGDYNSIRIQAAWETEVRNVGTETETIEEAFARVWEKLDQQIELKITEALEG